MNDGLWRAVKSRNPEWCQVEVRELSFARQLPSRKTRVSDGLWRAVKSRNPECVSECGCAGDEKPPAINVTVNGSDSNKRR